MRCLGCASHLTNICTSGFCSRPSRAMSRMIHRQLATLVSLLGPDILCFSSDYPHWDNDMPAATLQSLSPGCAQSRIFRQCRPRIAVVSKRDVTESDGTRKTTHNDRQCRTNSLPVR